ncbi:MAG TPA: 2-C-methyl-D-erythritol 4-phosphate cytidylyltransferase, partial [Quisquiliibacterium sp.]|nr:2-C-methyl-D-erythritol 4-phosphate cytidylyltransferase [Quisquiliibacterium sp.]
MSQMTTGDAPARVDADNAAVHVDDASAQSPGTARRSRCWAVVPAAGVGTRVGAAVPKQYLDLAGRSVLEWSLAPLLAADWIERVVLVLAPDDARAGALSARHPRLQVRAVGGAERRDSVLAGIES